MEEEEENLGTGGFASVPNVGGEGTSASQPGTGKSFAFRPCSFSFQILVLASPHPLLDIQILPRRTGRT